MTNQSQGTALPHPFPQRQRPADAVAGAVPNSWMRDMPAQEYHADKWAQSSSMLKPMLISPGHYLQAVVTPFKPSDAMDFGSMLHAAVLEPNTLPQVVALYHGDPSCRKTLTDFRKANPDRIVVAAGEYHRLLVAAGRVLSELFRGRPFYKFVEEGLVERSIYYLDPRVGRWCRVRTDLLHPDFTFDLKSTRHESASGFQRGAVDLHYDLQAYMYCLARCLFEGSDSAKPFVLVQAESAAPHGVLFRPCSNDFLENGKRKYEAALGGVAACTTADHWPAPSGEVEMDLHPWQVFKG